MSSNSFCAIPTQIIEGENVDQQKLMNLLKIVYGTSDNGMNNFRVEVRYQPPPNGKMSSDCFRWLPYPTSWGSIITKSTPPCTSATSMPWLRYFETLNLGKKEIRDTKCFQDQIQDCRVYRRRWRDSPFQYPNKKVRKEKEHKNSSRYMLGRNRRGDHSRETWRAIGDRRKRRTRLLREERR